jgi:hypothetical protein
MKEIELTQGKVALVDDEDYEYLSQWNWYASKAKYTFYARRNLTSEDGKRSTKRMQRDILEHVLGGLGGHVVDHINGDGLDNQRSNLRVASHRENMFNSRRRLSSIYKGITYTRGYWCAQIHVGGKRIHCGYYSTPEEAASAYDDAAKKYFGEFARVNTDPGFLIEEDNSRSESTSQMPLPKKRKGTTSRYKGVSYQPERCKWVAYIDINRKRTVLGRYTTQEDAAIAYNKAALLHFGDRAQLNKICGVQGGHP